MNKSMKNNSADVFNEINRPCKQFDFTAGMPKGLLAKGRRKSG